MSADTATVEIVVPRTCCLVDDDRVSIHLERTNLPKLRAYLYALEAGLIAVDGVTGRGHGLMPNPRPSLSDPFARAALLRALAQAAKPLPTPIPPAPKPSSAHGGRGSGAARPTCV